MKISKALPVVLTVIVLVGVLGISSFYRTKSPEAEIATLDEATADAINIVNTTAEDDGEMRGLWVTYMELSMAYESDKSQQSFEKKFDSIASTAKEFGFNTLIVQVRPFCDAVYESKYFPYSHILSGKQGENPNYDALKIMCDICKEYGLKIHAWINPYRVTLNNTPTELSDNNPYSADKSLGIEVENGIILDPSNEKVRELIVDGVDEIVENYEIDGVQFDDYFYPESISDEDSEQYEAYVENVGQSNSMSVENWRKANVNLLIAEVYRTVHTIRDDVKFGISPQGNLGNNTKLYADVKSWCSCKGFVDYICPQIYFSLSSPVLSFEDALDEWQELEFADEVELYVGLAGYKAGTDSDSGTWQEQSDILANEYRIVQSNENADGIMLYSYSCLYDEVAENEVENLKSYIEKNS